ncbi:MAG: glycoside hydrolase family 3 C-terminal domain-containing protein, partial [Methanococcaceae archaeon]
EDDLIKDAVDAASKSDLVLLFAGNSFLYESEGFDRDNIELPDGQNQLIDAVTKVNKNVIVILSNGQPVTMPWKNKVKAIVETWFGGEEIAPAMTDVLFGRYNPSGKLPVTFPAKLEDCLGYSTYKKVDSTIAYSDGLFVGYRLYDKTKVEPLFPFGFGLSYTQFEYKDIKLSSKQMSHDGNVTVTFTLTNKGKVDGAETVQLYVNDIQSSVERPEKELKGFSKIFLKAGESKQVEFTIDKSALSFYDIKTKNWTAESGEFNILIGSSSRDIKLKENFVLK